MKILCNGEERAIEPGTTVAGLVTGLGLNLETVVVEVNRKILQRPEYETTGLAEGDAVELIRFIGGG